MNQVLPEQTISRREIDSLARAMKIGFLIFTLIFSYFGIRLAFSIGKFSSIFDDMLGGKPLPFLTTLAINFASIWMIVSVILTLIAIGAVFVNPASRSALIISASGALLFVQSLLLWTALTLPFHEIITGLQG